MPKIYITFDLIIIREANSNILHFVNVIAMNNFYLESHKKRESRSRYDPDPDPNTDFTGIYYQDEKTNRINLRKKKLTLSTGRRNDMKNTGPGMVLILDGNSKYVAHG